MMDAAGLALSAWHVRLRGSPARRLITGAPMITGLSGGTRKRMFALAQLAPVNRHGSWGGSMCLPCYGRVNRDSLVSGDSGRVRVNGTWGLGEKSKGNCRIHVPE